MWKCMTASFVGSQEPKARMLVALGALLASFNLQAGPVDDLQSGFWYRAPNSNLRDVVPANPPSGNTGPRSIMSTWNGGAYDTRRDRLIIWGGGHADYSGNEIYVFDVDALQWERLTDPSDPSGGSESSGVYGDGLPRSTHTNNELVYAANTDRFYFIGMGGVWVSGSRQNYSGQFDFESNTWAPITIRPDEGQPDSAVNAYDPVTGLVWHRPGWNAPLFSYDPTRDTWTEYPDPGWPDLQLGATAAIDPDRRLMVAIGNNQMFVWDLDNPGTVSEPTTTGARSMEGEYAPGFAFDAVSKQFVAWHGGEDVYVLDPDTWNWSRVTPDAANTVIPTAAERNGTFGRFRYIPSKNVFVAVNSIDEDVYFYKLAAGGGSTTPPPPPVPPPAPPPTSDPSDFDAACSQSGVLKCIGFDSASELDPYLTAADDDQIHGFLDTSVSASGGGSLRFEIPPFSSSDSSGAWRDDLGGSFGEGDRFYVAFKQRFSQAMVDTDFDGAGWKQMIIHRNGPSCASVQLVTQNQFHNGFPTMYTDCGAYNFYIEQPDGDFHLQQGDYVCRYRSPNTTDCSYYRADNWMTFYYEVEVGNWDTPNSVVRAFVAYEGEPLMQFVDMRDVSFEYDSSPSDTFDIIQLTPYHTDKNASLNHPVAHTWYDDLIISTQPIYDVDAIPTAVRPMPPTGLAAQ